MTTHAPTSPSTPVLSVSADIDQPAERLYAVLADYREGHPAILPRPPFVSLEVEAGGQGAGTVIRVEMQVLGRRQTFRARVTEPEPGRTLVETNDTGYVTRFTVDPSADGRTSAVTISTSRDGRQGLLGALEHRVVARLLRPVYREELRRLGEVAQGYSGMEPGVRNDVGSPRTRP